MVDVAAELPELAISITRQDLVRYAGAANDYLPQHWDQAMMQSQGFADVVVHGWLGFAHLARAATQVFTPDHWSLAEYAVRYRQTIYPGEVRCGGNVRRIDAGRSEVSGWIRDTAGNIVTTAEMVFLARAELAAV